MRMQDFNITQFCHFYPSIVPHVIMYPTVSKMNWIFFFILLDYVWLYGLQIELGMVLHQMPVHQSKCGNDTLKHSETQLS